MANLAELSEQRVKAGLGGIIIGFGGATVPEQLVRGRDAARQVLRKYAAGEQLEPQLAAEQMREIDAWAERNNQALTAIMGSSAAELPAQLQLQMGSVRAQQFILSSYVQAAAGLGPWLSGQVGRSAAAARPGETLNEAWARSDAEQRLQMFAMIVKLDRDGALETIFTPPEHRQAAAAGMGALPVPLWFVAVVLVIFAAALVTTILMWRRIDANNQLMERLCVEGDAETKELCIAAIRDLQLTPVERLTEKLGTLVLLGGAAYLGLRYLVPWAAGKLAETDKGKKVIEWVG